MIINLLNKNIAKVLLFFAISPGSRYSRSEIKEKTELNNVVLDSALSELLAFKMIKIDKKIYSLNLDNEFMNKIINEIKEKMAGLPLKIQFMIIDFINSTLHFRGIEKIILFGSYAKLIYSEKSDIDIAVVFKDNAHKNKYEKKISIISEKLSKKHKREIQEHLFIIDDLKHKEDPLIKDILRNGRVLN